MSPKTPRPRLDEILSRQGKISEAQLTVALQYQKIYGGKLASHILHHGFLTEAELVNALSEHFSCPGTELANINLPKSTLDFIPQNVATARRVIPVAYHPDEDCLDVACENPTDDDLVTEIAHVAGVKNVKLYVAVETSLNLAIKRHYGPEVAEVKSAANSGEDKNHPVEGADSRRIDFENLSPEGDTILIVVRDSDTGRLLREILERDGHRVLTASSPDDIIDLTAILEFQYIFVHEQSLQDQLRSIRHIRDRFPSMQIRVFSSASDLLLDSTTNKSEGILQQNLELFTSLLIMKERRPKNYNPLFSRYVDQLCDQLTLTARQKMMVMNAAYLYDRAKFYYMAAEPREFRTLIVLATKLLQSAYYEPAVIQILRHMHIDLGERTTGPTPFELVAGNTLTIVDMFCDSVLSNRRVTVDQFEKLKSKLEGYVGSRLLPEIVTAFNTFMQNEILGPPDFAPVTQIMIYSDQPGHTLALDHRLRSERFRTIVANSLESFYHLCNRSQPDMLVMNLSNDPREIISLINEVVARGVDIKEIPTVLMVKNETIPALTSLCEHGIEDIIDRDSNLDFVVLKIEKIRNRWSMRSSGLLAAEANRVGSRGSLSDMNIIDLLQALGPGQRTTKIIATPAGSTTDRLEIYLDRGNIVFAQLGDLQGAEAIYAGMTWEEGTWAIEPIEREELIRSNNEFSNESILIEGCRLIDEMNQKL